MEKRSPNLLENKWFLLLISLVYLDLIFHPGSIGWMISPLYLIIIVTYITKSRNYGYMFYIISCLLMIILECLLLAYVYLFDSAILKTPSNLAWFLGFIVMTLLMLFIYIRSIITGELKNSINKPSKKSKTFHFNERSLKQIKEGSLIIILAFASSFAAFLLIFIKPAHFVQLSILGMILFMIGLLLIGLKIFELLRSTGFKI